MERKELKRKFEEFVKAFSDFMDSDICSKEDSVWRIAGDFDFTLPGRKAEFIPELNDFNEIAQALEDGESFSVPFATEEILKMSLATQNHFWIGSVCVDPVESSDDVLDWGFEIRDWNDRVVNEIFFSEYVPTELYLITEGVPFGQIAEDINAFVEGYGK